MMLETIRDERATFTVGSITVFIALMNAPDAEREALASLTKIWSGGAPIPPSTVKAFQAQFGQYIHNIYGLTETTSPSHGVPSGATAPVDDTSGALSVGVPIFNTVVRVVGDDGQELPPGEVGEIVTSGPMVVPGYWNKPEETEHALPGGALHTGDVGYMDAAGWFYLVDRKKDQINAGGYKVWPREVETSSTQHEAVREAAVVGVPDATAARPSRPTSACALARRPRPRSSSPSAASRWPPTSTPARSSSSTSCPRRSPASCSAANSATAASPPAPVPPGACRVDEPIAGSLHTSSCGCRTWAGPSRSGMAARPARLRILPRLAGRPQLAPGRHVPGRGAVAGLDRREHDRLRPG